MDQQHNLAWKGHEYASKEHCSVTIDDEGILINGRIRSRPVDIDLNVSYAIRLNAAWETQAVRIAGSFGNNPFDYDFQREGDLWTNWDGTQLVGAPDPDISFTPLTNTLPVRRLNPGIGDGMEIDVLYFDLEARRVEIRRQRYSRQTETQYLFETIPGDFRAIITLDGDGFVTDYPGLFSRDYSARR